MVAEHADHIHEASSHTARPHADCLDLASLVRGTLCAALFRGPVRHVRASERIFEAGEPADHLILIRSGLIKQMTVSRDGDELTVDIFGADDVFGEMCFRDHRHRYWATAIEPSEIVTLARQEFLDALSRRPDLLHQFLDLLAGRLSAAYAEIESRVFQSVVERLGRRLLQLAEMTQGSGWITLPQSFRHGELARLLGVRRESVTRAIQELRKRDIVESTRHGSLRIHKARLRLWVSGSGDLRHSQRTPTR
jgi:CRP/FNR family transcriptional regulator, cyclic AMP receptor protein